MTSEFFNSLYSKAQQRPARIAFVDGTYSEIIKAARMFKDGGFGTPYLVGKKEDVAKAAGDAKIDLAGLELIEMPSPYLQKFSDEYISLRQARGKIVTQEQAMEKMQKPNYVAMMYLKQGLVDGVVSGFTSETKPFVPAFEIIKTKPGTGKASSCFIMNRDRIEYKSGQASWQTPEQTYIFADCGLQENPASEDLADIGIMAADTAKFLGFDPKVAFLSYSTRGSAKSADVEKVQNAVALAQKKCPGLAIEGEMQFDTAIVPDVCKKKYPDSMIQGNANVLIFPDLDAGNLAYKITERLGGFRAIGPLLQGLNAPVQDMSRGAKAPEIMDIAVVCALQAMYK